MTTTAPAYEVEDAPRSVQERVLARIRTLVRENPAPGYRLPSERDLAAQLGVSRPTVREALRTLTHQGILETRHGAGTQVAQDPGPALETAFEFLLLRAQPSLLDLYDARELIEVYLAGRAAERRTEEEMAAMEEALRAMGDGSADPTDLRGPNRRFHHAVAGAAHSPVLAEILACLYNGIHTRIEAAGYRVGDWPVSHEIHVEIFEAIRRRNTQDAQRAMTVHMGMAIAEIRQMEEGTGA